MTDDCKISVLMTVCNGERYLRQAVDSILSQTFGEFEFVIINDGSIDATGEILDGYTDNRIRRVDNDGNRKLIYSLNRGLSLCRGKYVARMDADDIALPERLDEQFRFMESHPDTGICGSYVNSFYEETGKTKRLVFPVDDRGIRAFAFFQSPFIHPSVILRREVITGHNLSYPNCYRAEDYAFWTNMLRYTKGANIPRVLLNYRKHSASESTLGETQEAEMNGTIGKIEADYLAFYGFTLSDDEVPVYARFVNRSISYSPSVDNQRSVTLILQRLLEYFTKQDKLLGKRVEHYLSEICFYRFFISQKFPVTLFLLRLYLQGGLIYSGKVLQNKI
ncbi:MAG: glycosyltransferase [Dysgonamonadaceae bacterium]|jgi:glycosyltransferase involved in cell wall biosynthesis|nr:glycosyltransferase [Dysgonamonadaceae bacterium]